MRGLCPGADLCFRFKPDNVQLLALKPAEDRNGWIVRVQETAGKLTPLEACWLNQKIRFGKIKPRSVTSFRLTRQGELWSVAATNTQECDL